MVRLAASSSDQWLGERQEDFGASVAGEHINVLPATSFSASLAFEQ